MMNGERQDRFIQDNLPSGSNGPSPELRQLELEFSHSEAVELFKQERQASSKLRNACKEAEHLLNCCTVGNSLGHLSSLDNHTKVAIVAFTLQTPNIYRDFNQQSRNLGSKSWKQFPYKGMWLLLNKAILKHGNLSQTMTVYRGIGKKIDLSHSEFCFRQITSSSKLLKMAENFKGEYGTVFVLEISRGLYIKPLSMYGYEEEILLPVFDLFVVKKVQDTPNYRMIYMEAKFGPCQTKSPDSWCSIV